MGEPLDLLAEPVGVQLFYGIYDARVDVATALVEHPAVGDVVSEGVHEGVLQVRKELCRVEKFSSLQVVEESAEPILRQSTNCVQESERGVMSDDRRLMKQALLGGGQRVDTRGEHRLHCGWDLGAGERSRKAVAAARALEHSGIDQHSHDLFNKERIPTGALHQEALQGRQTRVGAHQGLKEFCKALTGKRVQMQQAVIRPVPPFVHILRWVTDHEEQASILRVADQLVQQTETKGIVPVKVLEDRDDRLHAGLAQQQAGDCLIRVLPMLGPVERLERMLLIQRIEKIKHRRNRVL